MLEEIPVYVKLKNSYNPAHYPANKKISAEEWNALWMSTMYQGNHQEDVLASILNITLPEFRLEINEMGSKYSEALSKAEEALGISNEASDTADEAKDIALEAKDIADQSLIDINLKQNIIDEGLNTTDKTIVGAINEVKTNSVAIANIINNLYSTDIDKPLSANMGNALREMIQGQEFGRSYNNIEDLVNALNEEELGAFKIPFLLLVIDLEVPDFWVAEVMETSVPYTYTTDEALIEAVKTEPLQIGYYKISISETAKIDLTNYVQKGFTIAGLNLEEDITKSALQTALDFNTLITRTGNAALTGFIDNGSKVMIMNSSGAVVPSTVNNDMQAVGSSYQVLSMANVSDTLIRFRYAQSRATTARKKAFTHFDNNGHIGTDFNPTEDWHYTKKGYVDTGLGLKVDKVEGKGLSTNDYTDEEKDKITLALTITLIDEEV